MPAGSFTHGTAAGVRRGCPCVGCDTLRQQQRADRGAARQPKPVQPAEPRPLKAVPTNPRLAAQLTVCRHASSVQDARELLLCLGLFDREESA